MCGASALSRAAILQASGVLAITWALPTLASGGASFCCVPASRFVRHIVDHLGPPIFDTGSRCERRLLLAQVGTVQCKWGASQNTVSVGPAVQIGTRSIISWIFVVEGDAIRGVVRLCFQHLRAKGSSMKGDRRARHLFGQCRHCVFSACVPRRLRSASPVSNVQCVAPCGGAGERASPRLDVCAQRPLQELTRSPLAMLPQGSSRVAPKRPDLAVSTPSRVSASQPLLVVPSGSPNSPGVVFYPLLRFLGVFWLKELNARVIASWARRGASPRLFGMLPGSPPP